MKDKTLSKVICRLITLITYICILFYIFIFHELDLAEQPILIQFFEQYMIVIIALAAPLIFFMLISIIVKYKMQNDSKIKAYRILDVIIRICCTVPMTIAAVWYTKPFIEANNIFVKVIAGIGMFIIINGILKFTLKETLSVSFITSDNL